MSRYIEQDYIGSAVSHLPTEILQIERSIELVVPVTDVIEIIKNAPTINIIRCGECKHWHEKDGLTYCDRIDYGYGYKSDDFCSYGEREGE